jgi:hypothetical protein
MAALSEDRGSAREADPVWSAPICEERYTDYCLQTTVEQCIIYFFQKVAALPFGFSGVAHTLQAFAVPLPLLLVSLIFVLHIPSERRTLASGAPRDESYPAYRGSSNYSRVYFPGFA